MSGVNVAFGDEDPIGIRPVHLHRQAAAGWRPRTVFAKLAIGSGGELRLAVPDLAGAAGSA